ncbi:preprotein translocase subunit SecG [Candidatus Shapirobacteria bacterium CG03_land_8_20_14_0_80_39_12]|uniref:Protein-export membrane protein SecG n=1 Tax=Candidatus Shapirobacteria bacterium CG03_land_8_20_14_0_80_39_12 TaxID=1974879 RepID=A0A2M7BBN5_9BACT|nr:MAG: preprotein translocase subunit SecG [Candidatus Shapirobacteria bacterium CG03_land_8_20_14_0_80_39_12]
MNKIFLFFLQIIFGVILIFLIILQGKGAGLSSGAFGNFFSTYSTKRGAEKVVFQLTILVAILFFLSSIAQLIFS